MDHPGAPSVDAARSEPPGWASGFGDPAGRALDGHRDALGGHWGALVDRGDGRLGDARGRSGRVSEEFDHFPAAAGGSAAAAIGAGAFDPPPGRLLDPGRRGLRALAVLAVIVLLGAAAFAWFGRPEVEQAAEPPAAVLPVEATPSAAAPAPVGATQSTEVVVSVTGRVHRPGLVRLPPGARVADAISAAGGVLPGTPITFLNLARRVTDGEAILVGVTPPPGSVDPPGGTGGPASGGTASGGAAAGGAGVPGGKVDLNRATVAQLDALPGVGPVLAARLVEFRDRNGGFRSVADLRRVEGIGGTRYERLKDLVTV
ncbi:ComEA family DNA-binding protein [Pilimelia anulata]|uniref:ComEA family DNA-binding protein n=1 Tax=Pilimelia anulata TaxID=53371 RepID=UPI001E3B6127|nr:ComEA family DNA-binding protein [Pilimelia anulata]